MKAIGYQQSLPCDHPDALLDITLPEPVPGPHDLLVAVQAIAVNPVDTKIRRRLTPPAGHYRVLGWDAAGIVTGVGAAVTRFRPGDRVWYAGARDRQGCNAEFQVVDERLVGHLPQSLGYAEAAALPLTTVTAWELLFDRLEVPRIFSGARPTGLARTEPAPGGAGQEQPLHALARNSGQHPLTFAVSGAEAGSGSEVGETPEALLILGAGGGVGSILTQLARQLTALTVIGTASRPETRQWVRDLGAHFVIDHHQPLPPQLAEIGQPRVRFIAALTQTEQHLPAIIEVIAPQGRLAVIDDPSQLDIMPFKQKSVSIHWEFMFTRSLFATPDMVEQHRILEEAARLVDQSLLRTTLASHFGAINAANLRRAHALIESGQARGKIVLEGFST